MVTEDYFRSVSIEVFEGTLLRLGAFRSLSAALLVRFDGPDWFVELLALASDGPRYSPRVAIGPLPEQGLLERDKQVDIMWTVPAASPLRRYNLEWRYENPTGMKAVFERIRDEIFVPHAVPILLDHESLEKLRSARSRAIYDNWQNEISAHNDRVFRAKAQAATNLKDYREYLVQMSSIPSSRHTKAERARIEYVKKVISGVDRDDSKGS